MRSKSEGCCGKGRSEKRTVVNIADGAGRSKVEVDQLVTIFTAIVRYLGGVIKHEPL
jgi:hypothetical protein